MTKSGKAALPQFVNSNSFRGANGQIGCLIEPTTKGGVVHLDGTTIAESANDLSRSGR